MRRLRDGQRWMACEDQVLRAMVLASGHPIEWPKIAARLERQEKACRVRFYRTIYSDLAPDDRPQRREPRNARGPAAVNVTPVPTRRITAAPPERTAQPESETQISGLVRRFGERAVADLMKINRGHGEFAKLREVAAVHGLSQIQAQAALHLVRAT